MLGRQACVIGTRLLEAGILSARRLARAAQSRYHPGMDDAALLELALTLARRAAEVILAIRAHGFETLRKSDASPVTAADREAEARIVSGLREATPGIPVVAEEEIAAGHMPKRADEFWLVDPLDGTREFAAQRDDFTVNIGLVRAGKP